MIKKISIVSLLLIGLFSSYAFGAFQTRFSDVATDNWFYKDITKVANAGLMQGNDDGSFRPDEKVSRGELAKTISSLYDIVKSQNEEISSLKKQTFLVSDDQRAIDAIEKTKRSTVSIVTNDKAGTGFFIGKNTILTASHVVQKEAHKPITVTTFDGKTHIGMIRRNDDLIDLALVDIYDGEAYQSLSIAKDMFVGETAIAIGNPFSGLVDSATKGIISGLNRSTVSDRVFVTQIDTAMNPGNSGGAIINLEGEVIGVARSIYPSDKAQRIGYSVTLEDIKKFTASEK